MDKPVDGAEALVEKVAGCPFCGAAPYVEGNYAFGVAANHPDPENDANHTEWTVKCFENDCPAEPEVSAPTRAEAVAAWNIRSPDLRLAGVKEGLEMAAKHLEARADHVDPPNKRVPMVDQHTASVLRSNATAIRSLGPRP